MPDYKSLKDLLVEDIYQLVMGIPATASGEKLARRGVEGSPLHFPRHRQR